MRTETFDHLRPRRFYLKAVKDKKATAEQGRPVYKDVEMFEAKIAGDPTRTIVICATEKTIVAPKAGMRETWGDEDDDDDSIHERGFLSYADIFRDEYEAWKKSGVMAESGTPLEMLAFLKPSRIAELKVKNVTTVEALIGLPDRVLKDTGMTTRDEREMARAWVENAEKAGNAAEFAKREAAMDAKLKALEAKLEAAMSRPAAPEADEFEDMDDDAIREELAASGFPIRKNASRDKMVAALRDIRGAVMADIPEGLDAYVVEG
jgi:hypothetical protein